MPAFQVERSTIIQAPAEQVFDTVADYSTWTRWSPWLGADKQATVSVSDDPSSLHSHYSWSGDVVGAGEMEHMQLDRPRSIEDEIRFIKPFKSISAVGFSLEPEGEGTKITWRMHGKLPWFLFWMRGNMETFVGMDYERGLKMLREYIETGNILSDTDIVGTEAVQSIDVYGIRDSCAMDQVGAAMEKAVSTAKQKLDEAGVSTDGEMISVYHPCDMKQGRFDFTTGFAVNTAEPPPAGIHHCRLPAGQALHVRHTGSYDNLGNSWSAAYQFVRYKKLKAAGKQDSYEIYRNDPSDTPPAQWLTDIYLPLK